MTNAQTNFIIARRASDGMLMGRFCPPVTPTKTLSYKRVEAPPTEYRDASVENLAISTTPMEFVCQIDVPIDDPSREFYEQIHRESDKALIAGYMKEPEDD